MTSQFQVLNKILQNKDISLITLNNLTEDFFFNYKAEFNFIKSHYELYKIVPDRLTFVNSFPDFVIQDINEPDTYLLEQLFKDYNYSYIASRFNNIKKSLESDNVDDAIQKLINAAENLRHGSAISCTNIIKDISRYDRFLNMSVKKDDYFISTGFPELDKLITGIDLKNENMVIAARTGVGKSWMLLKIATEASKAGKTVGIYSGEMSVDKVAFRIDTLLGGVNNKKITHGEHFYKDAYKNHLNSLQSDESLGPIKVITPNDIAGPATVDALRAFVEKEKLDILLIDQYSLLEDTSHSKVMHERVANISKAIKNLQVMKQIPIISVAQMNRTKNEDKDGNKYQDSTQIGLSDRIPQDATILLMLDKKDAESTTQEGYYEFTINVVKSRDGGDNKKLNYLWNFNNGDIQYIPNENNGVSSAEELEAEEGRYK